MPDLKAWFEGGPNENWNSQFTATQYAYMMEATRAATVWRGDWVTATAYSVGDGVYIPSTNVNYICAEAHTSGTFATDLAAVKWTSSFDIHNWYGRSASKLFQAVDDIYTTPGQCNKVIAVQLFGGPSGNELKRFNSDRYVASESGVTAKSLATHCADAPYVKSGYYGTATETSMVAEWVTATAARKREIEDEYVLYESNASVSTAWDGVVIKATAWAEYAIDESLIPCQYEGGPEMSLDAAGGDTGDFRAACKFSRQWKWILSKRYAFFESLGYVNLCQYALCSASPGNTFGAFDPDIYTPTPIWDAFVLKGQGGKTYKLTSS